MDFRGKFIFLRADRAAYNVQRVAKCHKTALNDDR